MSVGAAGRLPLQPRCLSRLKPLPQKPPCRLQLRSSDVIRGRYGIVLVCTWAKQAELSRLKPLLQVHGACRGSAVPWERLQPRCFWSRSIAPDCIRATAPTVPDFFLAAALRPSLSPGPSTSRTHAKISKSPQCQGLPCCRPVASFLAMIPVNLLTNSSKTGL